MLLAHASVLTEARSNLAALADTAPSIDASSAYEHVLITLDRLHDDQSPALNSARHHRDREALVRDTVIALGSLADLGVDALDVELLLSMLAAARAIERA